MVREVARLCPLHTQVFFDVLSKGKLLVLRGKSVAPSK